MADDQIKFVIVDGVHIPYLVHKPTPSEIVVHFYVSSKEMQQRHNLRFHSNFITCEWYQQKYAKSVGIQSKFHQAGYEWDKPEWDNTNHPIFVTGKYDNPRDAYTLPGYNRVELFGDNIPEEVAALFIKAYCQKEANPFA